MTIEERLSNLENLVAHLSQMVTDNKFYTDADIAGERKSINEITPYTETKTAYVGDAELSFTNVPDGNLSVYVKDVEGNYPNYTIERLGDRVTILFNPLENITEVTISVV